MMLNSFVHSLPVLLLSLSVAAAQSKFAPTIPNTPAGQTLQIWLAAFNSGDRSKLEEYVKTVDPTESVDGMLAFHDGTGGVDLLTCSSKRGSPQGSAASTCGHCHWAFHRKPSSLMQPCDSAS
jgi:hypothetical protein